MKKYRVYGNVSLVCSMVVEAESKEDAIAKAYDEFGGLTNYAGMGSCDCLVGVISSGKERHIYPDNEVEFDDVEEL